MWEIFSLAQLPYPAFTWNDDFISMLEDGYRLPNPCEKSCSSELYNFQFFKVIKLREYNTFSSLRYHLMTLCWNKEAPKRPSFSFLLEKLHEIMDKEKQFTGNTNF
jgi:hypothetical protein